MNAIILSVSIAIAANLDNLGSGSPTASGVSEYPIGQTS